VLKNAENSRKKSFSLKIQLSPKKCKKIVLKMQKKRFKNVKKCVKNVEISNIVLKHFVLNK